MEKVYIYIYLVVSSFHYQMSSSSPLDKWMTGLEFLNFWHSQIAPVSLCGVYCTHSEVSWLLMSTKKNDDWICHSHYNTFVTCSTNCKKATPTLQQHDQELDITHSPYIHACLWPNGLAFIYHIQQPGPDDTDFKNNDSLFTKQTLMTIWGTLSLAHLRPYYNTSHHKSYLWNPTVWD